VEQRQRPGVLDYRAEQVYVRGGLGDRLLNGIPPAGVIEIRVDGVPKLFDSAALTGGRPVRLLSQQLLVQRLIELFLDRGGDLRFDAAAVALHGVDGDRPRVTYQDAAGATHQLGCRHDPPARPRFAWTSLLPSVAGNHYVVPPRREGQDFRYVLVANG